MARPRNFLLAVLVLACGLSLWLARGLPWPGRPQGQATSGGQPAVPVDDTRLEPVHLRILNATGEGGLAGDLALLVPRLGCVVEGVGNAAPWDGSPSLLINRRLPADRAADLAARLGGIPVLKEWDGRTSEDAVLVLGADFPRVRQAARAGGS